MRLTKNSFFGASVAMAGVPSSVVVVHVQGQKNVTKMGNGKDVKIKNKFVKKLRSLHDNGTVALAPDSSDPCHECTNTCMSKKIGCDQNKRHCDTCLEPKWCAGAKCNEVVGFGDALNFCDGTPFYCRRRNFCGQCTNHDFDTCNEDFHTCMEVCDDCFNCVSTDTPTDSDFSTDCRNNHNSTKTCQDITSGSGQIIYCKIVNCLATGNLATRRPEMVTGTIQLATKTKSLIEETNSTLLTTPGEAYNAKMPEYHEACQAIFRSSRQCEFAWVLNSTNLDWMKIECRPVDDLTVDNDPSIGSDDHSSNDHGDLTIDEEAAPQDALGSIGQTKNNIIDAE